MKLNHITLAATLSAALVLQGCATMAIPGLTPAAFTASNDTTAKPASKTGGILKGAGIGCLAGGGLAGLFGDREAMVQSCLVMGAVGDVIACKKQLQVPMDAAAAAEVAGMKATELERQLVQKRARGHV